MNKVKVYVSGWLNYYCIAIIKRRMQEWDDGCEDDSVNIYGSNGLYTVPHSTWQSKREIFQCLDTEKRRFPKSLTMGYSLQRYWACKQRNKASHKSDWHVSWWWISIDACMCKITLYSQQWLVQKTLLEHEASNRYACRRTLLRSKNILKTANLISKGI